MTNIKNIISFDEFNAVVSKVTADCFIDDTYSPAYYDLSLRTALISTYAPEFELDDKNNNTLYECVYSNEAREIIDEIKKHKQYYDIETAIRNSINFRKDMITSGSMSMSDIALSKLFEVITQKIESIDTSVLTKDNMDTMIKAVNATQDGNFAESLVDTMLNKGLLAKSNRETRRKNIKQTKKAESAEK